MSHNSKIKWTNATVNFWVGCKKVSAGCKNCYMFRDMERYGQNPTSIRRVSDTNFFMALTWHKAMMIFTCSWSDFFIPEADPWRDDAWKVIKDTPHHTWQILTKRPERIKECLPPDWGAGYKNVWLGVSVENKRSLHRINQLNEIDAFIRFVSFEPLLEDLELQPHQLDNIDWVIIGGESGNLRGKYTARECHLPWIRKIISVAHSGTPLPTMSLMSIASNKSTTETTVFVKQLGSYLAFKFGFKDKHGGNISEWRDNTIEIREFPII